MKKLFKTFEMKLVFFTFFILCLFVYLYHIENSIKNYRIYKKGMNDLKFINLYLDNFLEKQDKFVNFDKIVKNTKEFNQIIDDILSSEIKTEFSSIVYFELAEAQTIFAEKLEYIERYKSLQASNLNSIYFIYDLNQHFNKSKISNENKVLINQTLFILMQSFINLNDNKELLSKNLKFINKLAEKEKDKRLELLYIHTKKTIEKIEKINIIKKRVNELNLSKKLEKVDAFLVDSYNKKIKIQLFIASLFFLFLIFMIIVIYFEHKITRKIKNELLAFKYAVENSDNSIILTDPNQNIIYVNENFELNSGYTKEEVLGLNPRFLSSGSKSGTYKQLKEKLQKGEKWEGEFINKRKNGSIFYEKASIVPIFLNNKLVNYLAIKLDITKYVKQKEKLELSSIAFDNVQEGILICDGDKKIITVNSAFENISGYDKSELIGMTPTILQSGRHDKVFYSRMWGSIINNGYWRGKIYDRRRDGEIIPIWLNITAIKDKNGKFNRFIAVHTNLKEIIETQEKADFLAYHDPLTNLPNRAKLEEDLGYSISLAKRNKSNLFVLFIDLDRFKIINDTLGHQIGDELLKVLAKRLKMILRGTDSVFRMGGDEFIVTLDSSPTKKAAGYVCGRILELITEPIKVKGHILNTSASIGVSMFPDDGVDISTLIKNADTAMYHAKEKGKNNFQYYDKQLSVDVHEQLKIEQALKGVLQREELYLCYQPQYLLNTKEIISFEALVRWEHPELGCIPPDKFITIAEDTGMIVDIGKYIFKTACKDFVSFKKINPKLKYMAINISSVQFKDKNFVDDVLKIVKMYNLKPSEVELEVTERYMMEFTKNNMDTMNNLRDLGFRFSIDDFGTGYSSMSYLTKLPIDVIKVDKAFIDDTPEDNGNVQISSAIVALSKSLGYSVIAEGIEYENQENYLKQIDCNMGQGFLFSKPLTFNKTKELLEKSNN
ncbi:diguanylate cyclase [Arcobacter sp. CECT 8983]|uniref:sensor domain-containing protein n=1 Tax=Arcobacter sp. CECT 8983 TaxID=2044508 RepID=UPI00100B1CBD|nr:bifunctional diguanylate cyclase/phosphodiesterase [Arcobacter sp. CECT 8983]RXJ90247.1 diguanylate cyclase [Arcobacter sp. CECT 8983]